MRRFFTLHNLVDMTCDLDLTLLLLQMKVQLALHFNVQIAVMDICQLDSSCTHICRGCLFVFFGVCRLPKSHQLSQHPKERGA